ncbi:type I restriction-modification system subunit M, partial [Metamycoplasma hominis]
GFDKFNIYNGDTLLSPSPEHQRKEPFDVIVSNPPYSIKWEGEDNPLLINDQRFSPAGILAPKSKADFAFILHSLSWLATDGVAAIVCFPGIMYRGGAEQKIRQYLVENNFIDAIIQLPSNLFFGTSISTCIMVLKKSKIDNNILFIDASQEFLKVTNNNKLTSQNINNIIDYYSQRKNISYISKLANVEDIKSNSYNLSVNSYVEKQDTSEKIDINVLNSQIKETVSKIETLRSEIDKIVA